MKTNAATLLAVILACLFLIPSFAAARGADTPENSIFSADNLSAMAFGLEGGREMRRLYYDGGGPATVQSTYGVLYLSIDVFSWLTINGGGGAADIAGVGPGVLHAGRPLTTAGFQASLFRHDIFEPSMFESRGTIELLGSYLNGDMADRTGTHAWKEYRASLLASAERFAKKDFGEDSHASPYSLRLFVGPYFSQVDPDGYAKDDEFGVTAGADIKLARGFSLGYEIRFHEYASHLMNVVVHF